MPDAPPAGIPPVALVTGAGRRIGRALALRLAGRGFDVAVHHNRSAEEAEEVAAAIRGLGRRAATFAADLGDEAGACALLPAAARALGPVGLLVNSAAVFDLDRPADVTSEGWRRHMAVNLHAPFLLTQAFAASLPGDARGLVVNLIDSRVWNPTPNYTSYTVSKIGLWGLTRHLALALAPRVRVNGIGPGLALAPPGGVKAFDRLAAGTPLGRGTSPDEIARALDFLIDQPSVTGQMLVLDGGQHLGWLPAGMAGGGGG